MARSLTFNIGTPPSLIPAQMPVISRGLPSVASALNDSNYGGYADLGVTDYYLNLNSLTTAQRSSVLVAWWTVTRPTIPDGPTPGKVARDFTLEAHTSTSGTKPTSGWTVLRTVTANTLGSWVDSTARDLSTYGWFRINVTAQNTNGVAMEIDLRDVRNGQADTISCIGDSNAQQWLNGGALISPYTTGSIENLIEAATGRAAPLVFNYGKGGATAESLLSDIFPSVVALPGRYVLLGPMGTNNAANPQATMDSTMLASFKSAVNSMITGTLSAGKVPILCSVPWGDANATMPGNTVLLNAKLDELRVTYGSQVLTGPDFYAISNGQHNLITDGRHFSYDAATQASALTSSHPMGFANGLTGYEACLLALRDMLVARVYS